MKKCKIIAIANQKGGVGKTTTSINLSASLGFLNKRILVIDMDPQANLTTGLGIKKDNLNFSTFDILTKNTNFKQVIVPNVFKNLDVAPTTTKLSLAEEHFKNKENKNFLFEQLELIKKDYDFIFIDCPPSLGVILKSVLDCADSVIIPVQAEFYALEGLTQLLSSISLVKRLHNRKLHIEGILMTMFIKKAKLSDSITKEVKNYFQSKVFSTIIYRSVKISESQSFGEPLIKWKKNCSGAKNYLELAKELLKNYEKN